MQRRVKAKKPTVTREQVYTFTWGDPRAFPAALAKSLVQQADCGPTSTGDRKPALRRRMIMSTTLSSLNRRGFLASAAAVCAEMVSACEDCLRILKLADRSPCQAARSCDGKPAPFVTAC